MTKTKLQKEFPYIAEAFENKLSTSPQLYKQLIYDYQKEKRGVSMERILKTLEENNCLLNIRKALWYEIE